MSRHTRSWWPAWAPSATCLGTSVQAPSVASSSQAKASSEGNLQAHGPSHCAQPCNRQQASRTFAGNAKDAATGLPQLLTQLRELQLSSSQGALLCSSQQAPRTKSPQLKAATHTPDLLHPLQEQHAAACKHSSAHKYSRILPLATSDSNEVSRCNDGATASASPPRQPTYHAAGSAVQDAGSTSGRGPFHAHEQPGADQETTTSCAGSHPPCQHAQAASSNPALRSASESVTSSSASNTAARHLLRPAALYGKPVAAASLTPPVALTIRTHGQQSVVSQQALRPASKTASIFESGVLSAVVSSRSQQPLTSNAAFRAQFLSVIPDASCPPLQPAALASTLSSGESVQAPCDHHGSAVQLNGSSNQNIDRQLPSTSGQACQTSSLDQSPLMTTSSKVQVCLMQGCSGDCCPALAHWDCAQSLGPSPPLIGSRGKSASCGMDC